MPSKHVTATSRIGELQPSDDFAVPVLLFRKAKLAVQILHIHRTKCTELGHCRATMESLAAERFQSRQGTVSCSQPGGRQSSEMRSHSGDARQVKAGGRQSSDVPSQNVAAARVQAGSKQGRNGSSHNEMVAQELPKAASSVASASLPATTLDEWNGAATATALQPPANAVLAQQQAGLTPPQPWSSNADEQAQQQAEAALTVPEAQGGTAVPGQQQAEAVLTPRSDSAESFKTALTAKSRDPSAVPTRQSTPALQADAEPDMAQATPFASGNVASILTSRAVSELNSSHTTTPGCNTISSFAPPGSGDALNADGGTNSSHQLPHCSSDVSSGYLPGLGSVKRKLASFVSREPREAEHRRLMHNASKVPRSSEEAAQRRSSLDGEEAAPYVLTAVGHSLGGAELLMYVFFMVRSTSQLRSAVACQRHRLSLTSSLACMLGWKTASC